MSERFYIWEDDERHGPYTERQIECMLEDRIISFSHDCEDAATGQRIALDELFEIVPDDEPEEDEWQEEDGEEEDTQEWNEETDDAAPPPNAILYSAHPTVLRYLGALALAALGIAFGLWLGPRSLWFFIGGFGVSALTIIAVAIDRSTRLYTVGPKRVETMWGLISKSSNEVRIEDIRIINVRKRGFLGLLGVGTVEFSSAGDSIDVAFVDIWAAHRVKALVREIQDEAE